MPIGGGGQGGNCGRRRRRRCNGARPGGKGAAIKRILKAVGRGGAAVAANVASGGAAGLLPGMMVSGPTSAERMESARRLGVSMTGLPKSGSLNFNGGGSKTLEDQLFEFRIRELKEIEGQLRSAMNQSEAEGGNGDSDSRSATSQKVQQLIQKRSQMIELLSNTLKTMHDSAMAVNRNIRT